MDKQSAPEIPFRMPTPEEIKENLSLSNLPQITKYPKQHNLIQYKSDRKVALVC